MDLQKVANNLIANGMQTEIVDSGSEARKRIAEIIPEEAQVMLMTSITLQETGINDLINGGSYISVKEELKKMDRATQNKKMQEMGSAPDYAIGSVHAITENGEVMVASNTGSQMAAYVYGSPHVIWIVGQQKIVNDLEEGKKRIYDYILPLESVRLGEQYGNPSLKSQVSKLLLIFKETNLKRTRIILVREKLGF